jgi:hypothetical protein
MSATKSKSYTVSGSGASYVIILDNDLKIKGIYENNKIVDPTNPQWSTIASSNETGVVWNQLRGTIGQTVQTSPTDITQTFYQSEYNKEINTSTDPKSIESSNNLFYSTGIVADPNKVGNPTQFLSPSSVNYGARSSVSGGSGLTNQTPVVAAYPLDIDLNQDYISFTKFQYQRTDANMSQPNSVFENKIVGDGSGKYGGTVILPMPKVSDSNGAEWGDSDLNIFGVALAAGFKGAYDSLQPASFTGLQNAIANPFAAAGNVISRAGTFLQNNAGGAAGVMGSIIASRAVKTLGISVNPDELLARATGKIANPNAELLFQGPVLRDFGFQFLMVARSQEEGATIRKIIKWFKQGAAPKYENQALLGTPDVFKLQYSTNKMNKFHQMALRTITVDYAPDGYWAAYGDSQPISVLMNLQFTELKPVYDVDQEQSGDDVGY